jgi:hypothetical protein
MKYLQYRNQFLNEGFSAISLSKTLGWLNKSGLKSSSTKFLNDLKTFCEKTSIPLSEISDQWFKTNVLKREAVKLRAPEEVGNPSGLWCLKFWFSAEEGYMGYTVTPKRSKELFKRKIDRQIGDEFNTNEINHLLNNKNVDNISTGELHPVIDYKSLKTGDIVCGYNTGDDNYLNKLHWFKVFLSHDRDGDFEGGYLISDDIDGSSPDDWYDENGVNRGNVEGRDIFSGYYTRGRGSSCWSFMSCRFSPADDHYKLHLYKPSDEPLHVFSEKEKEVEELDINSFNLSYEINNGDTGRVDQLNGQYNNWSIDNNRFKNSDFSIIFFVDDFLPNKEMSLKDIQINRTKSKEGALALMSNDEIKKINVEKRFNYLIDKFNLDPSVKIDNMTNLNSILMKMFLDDFILFKVFYGYNTDVIEYLYRFFNYCQNLEGYSSEDFKNAVQPHVDDIKRSYRRLLERYNIQHPSFKESYDEILKSNNNYAVEIFQEIMRISKKLKDKIRSKNIINLYDASIIIDRLRSMSNSETNNSRISYYLTSCLDNFTNKEDALNLSSRIDNGEFSQSMKALKFIERQVDMI